MKILCLLLSLIFIQGCATKSVQFSEGKLEGQWEAKAQIRDLEKNSSNTVDLTVMSYKNRALRMEVSGTLGIQVASVLLKGKNLTVLVHPQKRAMTGEATQSSLKSALKADIDPRWLYAIFFDSPPSEWDCKGDPVIQCSVPGGYKFEWTERDGEKKRIKIGSEKFELQILVKDFQPKVQSPEKAFVLQIPENYKRYKLN